MKDQFSERGVVVENAIGFWVQRVYQATRNEMYRRFREEAGEEVTPEQWMVLIRLWEQEGPTQQELCEATSRDAPTMSRIVDGMERRGWLVRKAHPEDGRVRVVMLTRKGRALEPVLVPIVKALVEKLVKGIPEEDLITTRATLRRMFENLS